MKVAPPLDMLSLMMESTEVPCSDGAVQIVTPGEVWPAPYRGSRYTLRRMKKPDGQFQIRLCWTRMGAIYHRPLFPGMMTALKAVKGEQFRGSIRITPWREVLCKKQDPTTGRWMAYYVGKLSGEIEFKGFELAPDTERGQYWRGFHFKHGETWSVWVRPGSGDHLYWSRQGLYFRSIKEHPELCNAIRVIRPRGGRIYITEHGEVWMNVPPNEIGPNWVTHIRNLLRTDLSLFKSSSEWDDLMESIAERYQATRTYPIYLGKVTDFDDGEPPRTYFENQVFNQGTRDEDEDDEDGFSSSGYRRMRRD